MTISMLDSIGGQSETSASDKALQRFGYKQELKRELGYFSSFALSFSIISVTTGLFADYGDGLREAFRVEAIVVSDNHALPRFFRANDVASDGPGDLADIFKREVVGYDAAPAICAKTDVVHGHSICERVMGAKYTS